MGETSVYCRERLSFNSDYRILGQLTDLSSYRKGGRDDIPEKPTINAQPIPPQMWVVVSEEEGLRRTREDPYGTGLTFVYAQQLKELKLPDDASPKNKAIKAFVDALPPETPIILYWS